jgi:hypothetical protein
MKRTMSTAIFLILLVLPATAQRWVNISYPWAFVEHHPAAEMLDDTKDSFVYGTERGNLIVMERDRMTGRLEASKQREVWAPVKQIRLAETTGDSRNELLVTTRRGDLFVIEAGNLEDVWRTPEGYFQTISCFTVGDTDGDGQAEIILIADDKLVIMAGNTEAEKYRSPLDYNATDIAIADVDGDGQDEIVLNTGQVLDAKFRQLEWEHTDSFGDVIDLFDIDGDGIIEIVGTGPSGEVLIIDGDERLVKWE